MKDESTNANVKRDEPAPPGGPYGRRLLPHLIDETAKREPNRECFSIPRSSEPKDGWKIVTFKEYANAINHCARRIIELCGPAAPNTFPTVAYIGPNDVRYAVVVVAAVKAGYKALFISPRNSQEAQINLFDKTDCHFLCYAKSHRATVQPWLQERDMKAVEVGPIERWFPKEEVEHIPYSKTWEDAQWEPLVVLHTSGSTGLPKPIICKTGMTTIGDAFHDLPDLNGNQFALRVWCDKGRRYFSPMPMFHAAGIFFFIISLWWETPLAFGIAERPVSSDIVLECLKHADIDGAVLPPSILEDMSQSREHTQALAKLSAVGFGGGNLAKDSGDELVKNGATLMNFIAATEFAPWPTYWQPKRELWQYIILNSDVFGADWRPVANEEDSYRLVSVRKAKHPGDQGFFYTFPEDNEYDTKDMFKPHPTLKDNWIYNGRSDNIIVFSNGEKLNPVTIEDTVEGHPGVIGALVVGSARFQPALFIEPNTYPKDENGAKELIDSVWPYVVRVNRETVAHGQIGRDFISLANPDKPFPRAGKGTIQRAAALRLYEPEIEELYHKAEEQSPSTISRLDADSEDTLIASIEEIFQNALGGERKLEADTDFFSAGVDSMQVINTSRLLRAGLDAAGHHVDAGTIATRAIYGNPTPRQLAKYIYSKLHDEATSPPEDEEEHALHAMGAFLQKYTDHLPELTSQRPDPADDGQTIILTGSTGMLGSYMLDMMVKSQAVKKIICLNRGEDGGVKQQVKAMRERGLTTDYDSKTEFWHADFSWSNFGLPPDVFERLLQTTDRVLHNAWPVNFNIPVESFEPHLRGVRNIGDFASKAHKRVAVVFVSSIGSVTGWDTNQGNVPEKRLEDFNIAGLGYGRSKMIGSLILEKVAESGNFPTAIIRVGQVAGPEAEEGVWSKQEWFPSIVASSLHLKALPGDLGSYDRVDWTPCERIAALVLEVGGVTNKIPAEDISGYYHGVNPHTASWADLATAVQEYYGKERISEIIPFKEWVERLDKSQAEDFQSLDKNPGVKLLDTYRGLASVDASRKPLVLDTKETQEKSPTMKSTGAVTPELMKHWCKQWAY